MMGGLDVCVASSASRTAGIIIGVAFYGTAQ
jgi:hypothetical protein